jgi:hypothetical protein
MITIKLKDDNVVVEMKKSYFKQCVTADELAAELPANSTPMLHISAEEFKLLNSWFVIKKDTALPLLHEHVLDYHRLLIGEMWWFREQGIHNVLLLHKLSKYLDIRDLYLRTKWYFNLIWAEHPGGHYWSHMTAHVPADLIIPDETVQPWYMLPSELDKHEWH